MSEATGPAGPQGGFCRQPLSRGEGFGVRVTWTLVLPPQRKKAPPNGDAFL